MRAVKNTRIVVDHEKITRSEVDLDRCCRRSPGARWIMRGAEEITRSEVDHDRCCRRSPGARWIMRGAEEDHQDRGGS